MAIVKAQVRKQYHIESLLMLRLLASGIKLTDADMNLLGLKAGVAQVKDESGKVIVKGVSGDTIHFAYDPDNGKTYILKNSEGSVIGATKTFTSSGLKARLMEMANGAPIENTTDKVTLATELKGGLQIRFNVAPEPVIVGEDKYFEVTFDKAIMVAKEEEEESEASDAIQSAKAEAPAETDWK